LIDEDKIRAVVRRVVRRAVGRAPAPPDAPRRRLLTERDLEQLPRGGQLPVPPDALITPLARQVAAERRIALVRSPAGSSPTSEPGPQAGAAAAAVVAIGADHAGFTLKESLKAVIAGLGYRVTDCGTDGEAAVDYPEFALAVAELVAEGRAWRGVLVDGLGIGSCIAANKVPGVRAALCCDQEAARSSRQHNDANVLTLGAGMIGASLAGAIVTTWLETPAEGGRHARRVAKIMDIERRFLRKA
jgi:ribose 5-phosphate isomerase B